MLVKDKFNLIYQHNLSEVKNIVPVSDSMLRKLSLKQHDINHIKELIRGYSRTRGHPLSPLIEREFSSCAIIDTPDYPLPAFITPKGQCVVNMNIFSGILVSDYSPFDVFALFLYAITFKQFATRKNVKKDIIPHIEAFIFAVFMSMYGKRAGLTGSYKNLIVKLRFFIHCYVRIGLFGNPQTEPLIRQVASELYFDESLVEYKKYNFSNPVDFLAALRENNIIPTSENDFSQKIIARGKVVSLPMFEDISRMLATLTAASVTGNNLFSGIWKKIIPPVYLKLLTFSIGLLPKR